MKCQGEILSSVWGEQERCELADTPILHLPARVVMIISNTK